MTNIMGADVAVENKKQINVKIITHHTDSLKDMVYSLEHENAMLRSSLELYKKLYHTLAKNNDMCESDNTNNEKDEN